MDKYLDPDWPVFELGEDDDIGSLLYELEPDTDNAGRQYVMVDQFLASKDFYQGLDMVTVIRRKSDGKEFGYFWWNDISKHGEAYMDYNGEEYGLESGESLNGEFRYFLVFVPVEPYSITAYREVKND